MPIFPAGYGEHVLGERDVRFRNTIAQPGVDHCFRAAGDLFRRLEQRDEGSAPRLLSVREEFSRAQQTRHVRVMTAGMCDADGVTRVVNCCRCRSVGQSRVFPHGKCVHVSSREYRLPFTIPQDADYSGTTNTVEDFVAEALEFRRHKGGSFSLLKAQLRMRV